MPLIDFTLDNLYVADLTASIQSAQLTNQVQSMYVDASSNLYSQTSIQVTGTGQTIVVPPCSQGYYPIICTLNSFTFSISSQSPAGAGPGSGTLQLFFMNVPFVQSQWSTLAQGSSTPGGYGVGGLGQNPLGS